MYVLIAGFILSRFLLTDDQIKQVNFILIEVLQINKKFICNTINKANV